jgi:branched-chain amino acid aminotransferase
MGDSGHAYQRILPVSWPPLAGRPSGDRGMIVLLNGRFVAEAEALVPVSDRGFLYGDGLFETLRVHRGVPFRWAQHLRRLVEGARFLGIPLPGTAEQLRAYAGQLIELNRMPESLLRVTLTRGAGPRGYSPSGANAPTLVMTLHPAPDAADQPAPLWRAVTASFRLPANEALARHKTCNKLPQILARAEAEARAGDEALLLNTLGEIVEGAGSNLFWLRDGTVCTPPLDSGILAGVTRELVLEICRKLGLATRETAITPVELRQTDGVFLSLSSWGIVEVIALDGHPLARSPLVARLQAAGREALRAECAGSAK